MICAWATTTYITRTTRWFLFAISEAQQTFVGWQSIAPGNIVMNHMIPPPSELQPMTTLDYTVYVLTLYRCLLHLYFVSCCCCCCCCRHGHGHTLLAPNIYIFLHRTSLIHALVRRRERPFFRHQQPTKTLHALIECCFPTPCTTSTPCQLLQFLVGANSVKYIDRQKPKTS
jgi:hypothetical protein